MNWPFQILIRIGRHAADIPGRGRRAADRSAADGRVSVLNNVYGLPPVNSEGGAVDAVSVQVLIRHRQPRVSRSRPRSRRCHRG